MSTPTLRQPRPIVGTATAKPQRVGLIAARSKVEAQDLAANVARALDFAGAEVVQRRGTYVRGAWLGRRDCCTRR